MTLTTVLKVNISCCKCKKKLLKAVSSLQGIDKIETDVDKGTLTVTGNADPYQIIVQTRKAAKYAEVVKIGPPPASSSKGSPKDKHKTKDGDKVPTSITHPCSVCDPIVLVPVADVPCTAPCSIM